MANQVKIDLSVQDTSASIKKRTSEVKDLNKELTKSQTLATGTRTGASAVKSTYSAAGESVSYGQARGSMGATGASGRDFANQAQGLGGLVRLYATYAANIFAVSAAFSSLREAMNTTMMIKGLDQLGAASGVAMGGLAKQFAAASDGAISLREAMEATAKATTSGLSTKQFMELGAVAKGASQALGVNMSDAVSRLTRGITKLEPELLDELGIFTKVGTATEAYARSVGKSASALTDFERRQAFANAVLAEGRQKFGEIAQESNPYDKLLASLKNVAQTILETVNKVIGPIAKLLADNSALIGVAIAAAAVKITQQALPALTSWRNGMKLAADEAAKRAQEINTSFGEAFVQRAEQRAKVPQLQDALKSAEQEFAQAKRQFVELDNIYKKPNDTLRALQKDRLLSEKELVSIKADVTKKTNENTTASLQHAAGLVKIQLAQQKVLDITNQLTQANDIVEAQASKRSRRGSEEWQREQIVIDSRAKAAKLNLLSGVGERVEQQGIRQGLGGFYSDTIANKDLGKIDKFKTAVTGTFAGIGTAASILGKSLMGAFMYLEIALVVFAGLNALFSKNGAAVDAFKTSLDGLAESTKTANNVTEKFGNVLTTDSINAKANAFTNLTDSIASTAKALSNADTMASGWDRFIDGFKTIWGGDLRSQFSKGFVESVTSAVELAPEGEIKQSLEAKLKGILGTEDLGIEGVANAIAKVPSKDLAQTAKNVNEIISQSSKILKNSQVLTQDVKETGKAASDAFTAFSTSVFGNTQLDTFLLATTKSIFSLKNAFKDVTSAAAEFKNILSGTTKLEFLPQEQALQLQDLASNYTSMQNGLNSQISDLDRTRDRINAINKELKTFGLRTNISAGLVGERSALQQRLPELQLDVRKTESALKEIAEKTGKVLGEATERQLDLVFSQTKLRMAQIDISSKQQVLQAVPVKTEASILETAKLAKEAVNVEFQLKKSNENLINSIDLLRIQMELRTAEEKLKAVEMSGAQEGGAALRESAQKEVDKITNKMSALKSGNVSELRKYASEDPAAMQAIMKVESVRVANKERISKIDKINMRADLELLDLQDKQLRDKLQYDMKLAEIEQKRFQESKTSDKEKAESAAQFARDQALRQSQIDLMPGKLQENQVNLLTEKYKLSPTVAQKTQEEIATQLGRTAAVGGSTSAANISSADTKAQVEAYKEMAALASSRNEIETLGAMEVLEAQKQQVAGEREALTLASTTGAMTDQEITKKTQILSIQDAEISKAQKLLDIEKTRTSELIAWTAKLVQSGATPEVLAERDAILARSQAATNAAKRDYDDKVRSANATEMLASRQVSYEEMFKNSFNNMADAIVTWAQTGKLAGKDLFNSLIADIARFELRQLSMQMWGGARTAIMGTLGMPVASAQGNVFDKGIMPNAKGNAFDYGIQAFAKGGAFTNQIVDSPTMFKFAKGTGLMGEAGPEAIMPLKRDSNGNLGVRAGSGGGNTEVVVNNYSSAQAETRETRDDKGNRRVEIVIGEAASGEMARPGSSTQGAMRNTYGIAPKLIRR